MKSYKCQYIRYDNTHPTVTDANKQTYILPPMSFKSIERLLHVGTVVTMATAKETRYRKRSPPVNSRSLLLSSMIRISSISSDQLLRRCNLKIDVRVPVLNTVLA